MVKIVVIKEVSFQNLFCKVKVVGKKLSGTFFSLMEYDRNEDELQKKKSLFLFCIIHLKNFEYIGQNIMATTKGTKHG